MSTTIESRIRKYIAKIEQIVEGKRNSTLYKIGCRLRRLFGLRGAKLLLTLCEINSEKCNSPLDDDEVDKIAASVDRSNVPVGDPSTPRTGEQSGRIPAPKKRISYRMSVSDVPVAVAGLLSKQVSLYPHCKTNTPSGTATVALVLEMFRVGENFVQKIEKIRNEPDKEKRNALKITLPAVVIGSEPQEMRAAATCTPNGMLMVDCDNIAADKMESVRQAIMALPYVITTSLSVSGRGLCALIAYEGTLDTKQLLGTLQKDFPCELDMSCSDISRLRIVTHDPDMKIKDEVFPAILIEQMEAVADDLEYVPFPADHLPGILFRWVIDTQRRINLKDPAMPAIGVLAVVSSVIGSSCRIEIKRGYIEPVALFTAVMADTGQAKSPSLREAIAHLNALQVEKSRKHKREMHEWRQKHSAWKYAQKQKERGNEPMPPQPSERYIVKDITMEAVAGILEANPLGVILYREEINAFFGGMDAYRKGASTDLQSWIETYDGDAITVDRNSKETIYVPHPSVSIVGGIQTEILKKTFDERKDFIYSGFGSRFLFVKPETEPVVWNLMTPDERVVADYERLIDRILLDRENVLEKDETGIAALANVKQIVFPLSEDARSVLFAFQERYARQAVYESAANAAAMNKAGRIAARLCLTLHCVRSIEETERLGGVLVIPKETAENAVAIADWFMHEAERVYAMLDGEQVAGTLTNEQRAVMKVLKRKDKPMTSNEIRDASGQTKKLSVDDVEKALRALKASGKVESQKRQNAKGRPTIEWKIRENF